MPLPLPVASLVSNLVVMEVDQRLLEIPGPGSVTAGSGVSILVVMEVGQRQRLTGVDSMVARSRCWMFQSLLSWKSVSGVSRSLGGHFGSGLVARVSILVVMEVAQRQVDRSTRPAWHLGGSPVSILVVMEVGQRPNPATHRARYDRVSILVVMEVGQRRAT